MVPDEDLRNNAVVKADTSASLSGKSREPPQLEHSTDGPKNHCDRVFILSVCLSCT